MTMFVPAGLARRDAEELVPSGSPAAEQARNAIRQHAVEQLGVLDTAPEERFDRLTRLACRLFGVTMASVTFADNERLWIKSSDGAPRGEYPIGETFCGQGISHAAPLVVTEPADDPRFASLPSVLDGSVQFYAGNPLRDANGIVVGMFCLADGRPRTFDEDQQALLAELTGWAQQELVNSADSVRARDVQQRLLPHYCPTLPGYDVAGTCLPSREVGGDFYDWEQLGDSVGFVLADVMGKGTGAAILSATARAAVRGAVRRDLDHRERSDTAPRIADMVRYAARVLDRDLAETGTLVTAFFAMVDPDRHVLTWVDAGHGLAVVVHADGSADWLAAGDLPMGALTDAAWTQHTTPLGPGDLLVVCSDGLLDLFGGTAAALDDIVRFARAVPEPAELVRQVRELTSLGFAGDDVTVLAVRRAAA